MRYAESYRVHDPGCLERAECFCDPLVIEPSPDPVWVLDLAEEAMERAKTARMIRSLGMLR